MKSKMYIAVMAALFLFSPPWASAYDQVERSPEVILSGHKIFSWDKNSGGNAVEVGVTIPFDVIKTPPQKGDGPAGAIAVVAFPKTVQDTTCMNHFELNWEEHGHEPPVFMVPHFDFHFYGVPVKEVMAVSSPDPKPPLPDFIPAGFIYPGADQTVPQMGVHAIRPADLEKPFTDVLIFGFYGGRMTFIEPMITRSKLLQKQSIVYTLPVPPAAGRITRFPTKFILAYDYKENAINLIFSDFVATSR